MSRILIQILAIGFCLWIVSCQSKPKKEAPKPASQDAKAQLMSAQAELAKGREKAAVMKLKKVAAQNPGTDAADTAWILVARAYFQHHDYKDAGTAYLQVLNAPTQTAHEEEAYVNGTKSMAQIGRADEALSLSSKALASGKLTSAQTLDIQKVRYPLLKETGDILGSLRSLVAVHDGETDSVQREILRNKAFDLANHLQRKDLDEVASGGEFSFVRGFAAYRIGTYYLDQHDLDNARSMFEKTLQYSPNTNVAATAANQIQQIDGRRQVDPFTIGAVLPLTGHYESIAQKTLHGLQLGLGIYGPSRSSFKLAVIDSEGSPEDASKGVETLVADDHAIAIVGSLLSRTSVAVATKANELAVPSVALSQKSGLTDIGTLVFRNAITSSMQVQHLVKTAIEDMGMKKFAILYPNDAYGVEYANLFWSEVLKRGGQIVGAQPYSSTETDFRAPVRRLVGTYYIEDRQTEFKNRLTTWFKDPKNPHGGRTAPPDDLLPPVVDFDGLFVPDGPKAMGQIAPMLAYVGVQNVHFLGTNLWNSPEFLRRGEKHVEGSLFVDAQITTDPHFASSRFYNEFKQVFGSEPGLFELQGFETGLLLARLINDGERSRLGLGERLARIDKFEGVLGPLQMTPERELTWPMTAFTVREGAIVPLSAKTTPGNSRSQVQ